MTGTARRDRARRLGRAALVAAATSGAGWIFLWVMALALIGPGELLAPAGFGLFGPPVAYCLVRPTIVMSLGIGVIAGAVFFLEHPRHRVGVIDAQQLNARSAD